MVQLVQHGFLHVRKDVAMWDRSVASAHGEPACVVSFELALQFYQDRWRQGLAHGTALAELLEKLGLEHADYGTAL